MATKKITVNELRSLVKQIMTESKSITKNTKSLKESKTSTTKKVTSNGLTSLVKQIIKEEGTIYDIPPRNFYVVKVVNENDKYNKRKISYASSDHGGAATIYLSDAAIFGNPDEAKVYGIKFFGEGEFEVVEREASLYFPSNDFNSGKLDD